MTYVAESAYVDRCVHCHRPAFEHGALDRPCPGHASKYVVVTRVELDRLRNIEEEAHWVRRGREISRQAALNAIPDLIRALKR